MPLYIRKRIKVAPGLALNISTSGLGISAGPKGFKVSHGPRGTQLHAGRGGIYYRKSLNGKPRRAQQTPSVPVAVGRMNGVQVVAGAQPSRAQLVAGTLIWLCIATVLILLIFALLS